MGSRFVRKVNKKSVNLKDGVSSRVLLVSSQSSK